MLLLAGSAAEGEVRADKEDGQDWVLPHVECHHVRRDQGHLRRAGDSPDRDWDQGARSYQAMDTKRYEQLS